MNIYFITAGFVGLDLITGIVKAIKEKNFCSSIMREGLYHKIGSVLCVLFASLVDYAQAFIDLGVSVPVTAAVCCYLIIMEIGSIIENVSAINPEIMSNKLKSYFQKLADENEKGEQSK